MFTLFVRHRIDNFAKWKNAYDQFSEQRKAGGVKGASVHRDVNDPNAVIVTHTFEDREAARRFSNSDELKKGMAKAGVRGAPEFWFGEDVEQTTY